MVYLNMWGKGENTVKYAVNYRSCWNIRQFKWSCQMWEHHLSYLWPFILILSDPLSPWPWRSNWTILHCPFWCLRLKSAYCSLFYCNSTMQSWLYALIYFNKWVKHEIKFSTKKIYRKKLHWPIAFSIGEQKVHFYFFKRPERYNQEVLSHSFICLPLPYMEGIVLICSIDLCYVMAIFNGTGDMFNRWHFYTLNTNWGNRSSPRSLTLWCSHLTCMPPFQPFNNEQHRIVNKQLWATGG